MWTGSEMAVAHVGAQLANIYGVLMPPPGAPPQDKITPQQARLILLEGSTKGVLPDRKYCIHCVGGMILTTFSSPRPLGHSQYPRLQLEDCDTYPS